MCVLVADNKYLYFLRLKPWKVAVERSALKSSGYNIILGEQNKMDVSNVRLGRDGIGAHRGSGWHGEANADAIKL